MTYGVGGENGGWADKLKRQIHVEQYGGDYVGDERMEVYNFARPGMTVEDVTESLERDIYYRKHDGSESMIILSVGLNNSKAIGTPDNYISTLDSYAEELGRLFDLAHSLSGTVLFVGYTKVNEDLMNQRISPLTGDKTYFTNDRICLFDKKCKELCADRNIQHIDLIDSAPYNWLAYLSGDGLHVNDKGHTWIFEEVWNEINLEI